MATQTLTRAQYADTFAPRPGATEPSAPTHQERKRQYKEYLTPAFHRRFVSAAGLTLAFCWIEAILFSSTTHILWSWFPLGRTGLRTLLLFLPCLAVMIVRVANMHVGQRTTTSPAETLYAHLADVKSLAKTFHTVGWYTFSAWFFGEVFMWSRTEKAGLSWIDPGHLYERPRLNENPIALRCLFVVLGILQAVMHLQRDYDVLRTPLVTNHTCEAVRDETVHSRATSSSELSISRVPRPLQELHAQSLILVNRALKLSIVGLVFGFNMTYWLFLRKPVWDLTYVVSRMLNSDLPPSSRPSGLVQAGTLLWQACYTSFLLVALWELTNAIFNIFVAQPPLRKGEPLTNEIRDARGVVLQASRDPNGSLIAGLKSRKEVPKSFAFWELHLICTQFDRRRRTFYTGIDRKDGSTWNQVCKYALVEIEQINQRIKTATEPVEPSRPQMPHEVSVTTGKAESAGLRKIADQTVQDRNDVFAKRKPDLVNTLGNLAKSIGQSPNADPLGPRARKAIEWTTDRALTKDQRQDLRLPYMPQGFSGITTRVLRSPVGEPCRRTFSRSVKAVVFGIPHSNRVNIIHATKALTALVVHSLEEDQYGQVSKDIAKIVRVFTKTIQEVERFIQSLKPHWTDVLFTESDRDVEEVTGVLEVLKSGLESILLHFGEYAVGLGLSKKELREAREAQGSRAGGPAVPMAQIGR